MGKRSTARYCSTRCRTAATRARKAGNAPPAPVALVTVPAPKADNPEAPPAEPGIIVAARDELAAAGVLHTPLGQAAMLLAQRLTNEFETGSAIASLAKQWQLAHEAALNSVKRADRMDEVRRRRDEKLRAARGA
ncbi:hypothetical protein Lxx24010 [Leifsonia xyli subsp. xyli str. CTCB07]|uniref:Terminase small subunit n=1 Tax=Leifsonia xyli subsp. xyli (strain CTCB07) TaxID=281090 RepID=Q6AC56_LEIXX|nr:hypothetical protein Lxx24010 [Leifsonia xyli subsp. xyli str. CTCB07]